MGFEPLNIIVADDHQIIRVGVKFMLSSEFNVVIHEASNGEELFKLIKNVKSDIILMDINMPNTNSQGLLTNMLLFDPNLNIIVFSVNKEELYGKPYLRLGARGYVQKDALASELVTAIKCVLGGNVYMRKKMQQFYLGNDKDSASPFSLLSEKELELLPFLIKGDPLLTIAKTLNLSPSTIGTHKRHIFKKLNVANIVELKEMALLNPVA